MGTINIEMEGRDVGLSLVRALASCPRYLALPLLTFVARASRLLPRWRTVYASERSPLPPRFTTLCKVRQIAVNRVISADRIYVHFQSTTDIC